MAFPRYCQEIAVADDLYKFNYFDTTPEGSNCPRYAQFFGQMGASCSMFMCGECPDKQELGDALSALRTCRPPIISVWIAHTTRPSSIRNDTGRRFHNRTAATRPPVGLEGMTTELLVGILFVGISPLGE